MANTLIKKKQLSGVDISKVTEALTKLGEREQDAKVLPKFPGLGDEVAGRVGVDAGAGAGVGAVGVGAEKEETAYDKLVAQLTTALTKFGEQPSLSEEKERLEEEKGVETKREIVGSFEEEISKTQTLLDELEEDITSRTREFLVADPQRRRIEAAERAPITKEFGRLTRGLGVAEAGLARTEKDILTELGLIEKERTLPLDLLQREVNIRSQIKSLVDKDIPNVVSSTFDDEGDLTLVMQDPATGELKTQTISGIGKKAAQYQSFTSQIDNEGNLTIIGITKDGKATTIGTFKGVGKATEMETTDEGRIDQTTTFFEEVKDDQGRVSADDYIAARRKWIASGGNITDFKSAYPDDMIREEQFITTDWFIKTYGEDDLVKTAKEEGYGAWTKAGKSEMETYLEDVMKSVEAWRTAGKTDKEILAEMLK